MTMIVVKLGGGDGNRRDAVLEELARCWHAGQRWVLVHGGSASVDRMADALGHPRRTVETPSGNTSRRTDRRTAEIFTTVLAGEINKSIVEQLQGLGVNAVGLSGLDGRLLEARRKTLRVVENGRRLILRDDFTGRIERVNAGLLRTLLDQGFAPVVCPPAIGQDHEILNVDADRAAAAIAGALDAEQLLLLTGVRGLLRDPADPGSLIEQLPAADLGEALEQHAQGPMRRKLRAAAEALDGGIAQVVIAASHGEQPVTGALAGDGTVIR